MLFPQYLIVAVMLSVVLMSPLFLKAVNNIAYSFSNHPAFTRYEELSIYSNAAWQISIYSLIFIAVVTLFYGIRKLALRNKPLLYRPTWGCGYTAPTPKIQYTGKSFSKPLSKIFNFLLIEDKQFEKIEPREVFPKKRTYLTKSVDFIEHRLLNPLLNQLVYLTNHFMFIQNGRIQSYVLYGILFIVSIFILTVFNLIR